MLSKRKQYPDLYSWSHPLGDHVLAHQDGAVSTYLHWSGFDVEMLSDVERWGVSADLLGALNTINPGYCAEFHFWREWDASLATTYRNRKMKRPSALARAVRDAQADHLSKYGMANQVGVVLTKEPSPSFWGGAKTALKRQSFAANELIDATALLASKLPGGRHMPLQSYYNRIYQSHDRRRWDKGHFRYDPKFLLSESILAETPSNKADDHILIGGHHSKVLLLHLYPDSFPGWFLFLSTLSIPLHISFSLRPLNKSRTLQQAERDSRLAEGTASERGAEDTQTKVTALSDFRHYIVINNLPVFQNSFVIHLHGSVEENKRFTTLISDWINKNQGQIRDQEYIQHPYWRSAQPGQGYRSVMWRPDEGEQIANMLPVQVFRSGEENPESLRLGDSGQLIGFSLLNQPVAHSFTVAITGGGKGVDKIATIAETYPMGMDWYIQEIGPTYRDVVEGFGGSYTQIDPRYTVVNPLPPYSLADTSEATRPLDSILAGTTVNALAFLLTDGRTELTVHETASGQAALQLLYSVPSNKKAPLLPDLLRELQHFVSEQNEQKKAAKSMAENLESFLGTTEGRLFSQASNLTISEGICGVDLKDVDKASPKLLQFYLIFIALQYTHLAFSSQNPSTTLMDEMHRFIAVSPEVVGSFISMLTRTGRKDGSFADIVTQGIKEMDAIENEVINSMPLRSLLYRSDDWDDIASRINMPDKPKEIWKGFAFPLKKPYRPAMRSVGPDYYHLFLTFPDILLDLGDTSPDSLKMKAKIAKTTDDPLERLRLLREYKEGAKK
mgnify:CR=1 FL=1